MKLFLNSVVSTCGIEYLWPRFLKELSNLLLFCPLMCFDYATVRRRQSTPRKV